MSNRASAEDEGENLEIPPPPDPSSEVGGNPAVEIISAEKSVGEEIGSVAEGSSSHQSDPTRRECALTLPLFITSEVVAEGL